LKEVLVCNIGKYEASYRKNEGTDDWERRMIKSVWWSVRNHKKTTGKHDSFGGKGLRQD